MEIHMVKTITFILIAFIASCNFDTSTNTALATSQENIPFSSYYEKCNASSDTAEYFLDTITVPTAEALVQNIGNNRLLKLTGDIYLLNSTLEIDSVQDLKLLGINQPKIQLAENTASVLHISNTQNIALEGLEIGAVLQQHYTGEQGIIRLKHSVNIHISNCQILGAGTFGLVTYDVCNVIVENSEITQCTATIFELEKSRKVEFKNTSFQNNNLNVSVLGGFTNGTKEIVFNKCQFQNNQPAIKGNPAFNFNKNYQDTTELIEFNNCIFKNNKGYKWYGDKIKLNHCEIDSSDFIGY